MPDLSPTLPLPTRPDRRGQRLPDPPCPRCGGEHTHAVTRTEYVLYWRCRACFAVWSVPKPGVEAFG